MTVPPSTQQVRSARLTVVSDDGDGACFTFPISPSVVRIGRAIENDIVLSDERVSRVHARLTIAEQHCEIEDLRSRTGVAVNGRMIGAATRLHTGDLLRFGSTLLRFTTDQPAAEAPPAHPPEPLAILLVSTMAQQEPERRPLFARRYTIGRAPECDIVLAGEAVSRYHAGLSLSAGLCEAVDLGSAGGTLLNGGPLAAAEQLRLGDILRVGPYALQLAPVDSAAKSAGQDQGRRVALQPTVLGSASQLESLLRDTYFLICLSGSGRGVRYPLAGDKLLLGSGADCRPRLADVPALAATMERDREGFQLLPAAAAAGVRVSGGRSPPCRISAGDLVDLGGSVFRLIRHGDVFSARFDVAEFEAQRRPQRRLWLLAALLAAVAAAAIVVTALRLH